MGVRAVVEFVALEDRPDQGRASLGVGDRQEAGLEVVEVRADVGGVDATVRLPALLVHKNLSEISLGIGSWCFDQSICRLDRNADSARPLHPARLLPPEPSDPLPGQTQLDHLLP